MRLEALFTELAGYDGRPTLAQTAHMMGDYREEWFYLARIPVRIQRILGALVRGYSPR